jgi:hypothetical protein
MQRIMHELFCGTHAFHYPSKLSANLGHEPEQRGVEFRNGFGEKLKDCHHLVADHYREIEDGFQASLLL